MNSQKVSHYLALVPGVFLTVIVSICPALTQSSIREKRHLKNFGSSLKQIEWDPLTGAAVDSKRKTNGQRNSNEEDVVRVEISLVVSDVLVLDGGKRPVQGLTRDDFLVTENSQPQRIEVFSLGDNATIPRSIVLIIDYSRSQFPYLKTSVEAAKALVDKLAPLDRMAIVTDDVDLLVNFTQDKKKLKEKLESLKKRTAGDNGFFSSGRQRFGRSAQYSALMATLREAFDDKDLRPIIIFQTDGDEAYNLQNPIITPSVPPNLPADMQQEAEANVAQLLRNRLDNLTQFSLSDVYKAAEKSRATIYTVIPGFRLVGLSQEEQIEQVKAESAKVFQEWSATFEPKVMEQLKAREADRRQRIPVEALRYRAGLQFKQQSALAVLGTLTGGWTEFLQDPSQANEIYSRIFSDINRRYLVGYYPTNKEHDGKQRAVNVEVRGHPEYEVMGRKTYYAPGPDN